MRRDGSTCYNTHTLPIKKLLKAWNAKHETDSKKLNQLSGLYRENRPSIGNTTHVLTGSHVSSDLPSTVHSGGKPPFPSLTKLVSPPSPYTLAVRPVRLQSTFVSWLCLIQYSLFTLKNRTLSVPGDVATTPNFQQLNEMKKYVRTYLAFDSSVLLLSADIGNK